MISATSSVAGGVWSSQEGNRKDDLIVKESEHEPCCELDLISISQGAHPILGKTIISVSSRKHQPSYCNSTDRHLNLDLQECK